MTFVNYIVPYFLFPKSRKVQDYLDVEDDMESVESNNKDSFTSTDSVDFVQYWVNTGLLPFISERCKKDSGFQDDQLEFAPPLLKLGASISTFGSSIVTYVKDNPYHEDLAQKDSQYHMVVCSTSSSEDSKINLKINKNQKNFKDINKSADDEKETKAENNLESGESQLYINGKFLKNSRKSKKLFIENSELGDFTPKSNITENKFKTSAYKTKILIHPALLETPTVSIKRKRRERKSLKTNFFKNNDSNTQQDSVHSSIENLFNLKKVTNSSNQEMDKSNQRITRARSKNLTSFKNDTKNALREVKNANNIEAHNLSPGHTLDEENSIVKSKGNSSLTKKESETLSKSKNEKNNLEYEKKITNAHEILVNKVDKKDTIKEVSSKQSSQFQKTSLKTQQENTIKLPVNIVSSDAKLNKKQDIAKEQVDVIKDCATKELSKKNYVPSKVRENANQATLNYIQSEEENSSDSQFENNDNNDVKKNTIEETLMKKQNSSKKLNIKNRENNSKDEIKSKENNHLKNDSKEEIDKKKDTKIPGIKKHAKIISNSNNELQSNIVSKSVNEESIIACNDEETLKQKQDLLKTNKKVSEITPGDTQMQIQNKSNTEPNKQLSNVESKAIASSKSGSEVEENVPEKNVKRGKRPVNKKKTDTKSNKSLRKKTNTEDDSKSQRHKKSSFLNYAPIKDVDYNLYPWLKYSVVLSSSSSDEDDLKSPPSSRKKTEKK